MTRIVYADNAATMKIPETVFNAILPYLTGEYGNSSTMYSLGRTAKQAIETSRIKIAKLIGALPEEIYFTNGGTESDNWAIKSVCELRKNQGRHIITTAVEHPAVLNTCKNIEENGGSVTYLGVDRYGCISLDDLRDSIRDDTILITVMTANNEIGTIMPISEIGEIARKQNILFHTDAVQAAGHISVNVNEMNLDLLSLSAHKFGGMKGIGILYVKKGINIPPFIYGGGQEKGKRSGTENVAGIVSLAVALEDSINRLPHNNLTRLRDRLIDSILKKIPQSHLTGDPVNRLPGIASFVFENVEGESLLLLLDQCGIYASSGSACSSGSLEPSHVLTAIGLPIELIHGSLRLSLSENNTGEDVDYILEKLPNIIERLRQNANI